MAWGDSYVTAAELKGYLGISDTVDDTTIGYAVSAASRAVDQHCTRQFNQTASGTVRTFEAVDFYRLVMPGFSDVVSVSALATDDNWDGTYETVWTTSDYQLWPPNTDAAPETAPYTEIRAIGSYAFPVPGTWTQPVRKNLVQVTGVFGWPEVPADVKQATFIVAAEIWKLKDAPFGALGMADLGIVRVGDNRRAASLLAPYVRFPVLVA